MKQKKKYLLISFYFLFFILIYNNNFAQSALSQLETMAGQRVGSYNVPTPTYSNSNSNYNTISWAQRLENLRIQREQNAKECCAKGEAAMRNRNWADAVHYFQKAARKHPSNSYYKQKLAEAQNLRNKELDEDKNYKAYQKSVIEDRIQQEEKERRRQELAKQAEEQKLKDIKTKIEEATDLIKSAKKDIKKAQGLLKVYTKTLQNNNSELEKWSSEVDAAYNNVLKNSKTYLANMFVKYNLMGGLDRAMQKDIYNKMGNLMHSSNPQIQKWLTEQLRLQKVKIEDLEEMIGVVSLNTDAMDLAGSNTPLTKRKLDGLLFLNSLMETYKLNGYDKVIKTQMPFGLKAMPSEYFEQAKMIGETYSDLAAICLSWYEINKTNASNEEIANQVSLLSAGMEQRMNEVDCLQDCLKNYSERCIEKCTGRTKWSKPPPPLGF